MPRSGSRESAAVRRHLSAVASSPPVESLDSVYGEGAAFDPGGLSLADRDRLTTLRRKVSTFRARGMERADTLEAEMVEIAGVEDVGAIDFDRL